MMSKNKYRPYQLKNRHILFGYSFIVVFLSIRGSEFHSFGI